MRLEGVVGQERAQAQLVDELEAGKLAHAYIFAGPEGCGRGSTALALFRALSCPSPQDGAACGVCGHCRRALAGQHENLVVLEPPAGAASSQIKVEEVREAIRAMSFKPLGGGRRMVLIRRAENLNPASIGALLKTLEEPPPENIIILTVQDPRDMTPTIVSRCRRVNFRPLEESEVAGALRTAGLPPEEVRLKAALSSGSLGRAQKLDAARLKDDLQFLARGLAGRAEPLEDLALAQELTSRFRGAVLDRAGLTGTLDLLGLLLRDMAVKASGRADLALLPPDATGPGAGKNDMIGLAAILEAFEAMRRAQSQLLGNASPELALAVMFGRIRECWQAQGA